MRLVIKTGSAILSKKSSDSVGGLDRQAVEQIVRQLVAAHQKGHELILVTSGAIAAGVARLGWTERPTDLRLKQAAAAVGQLALMEAYEAALSKENIIAAQILLTREDFVHHQRYLNIRNTLLHLLSIRALPIINENDSVSTDEIQFGDNDTLAAVVATKVGADKLVILSDVPGLFEQDASGRLTDRVIPVVDRVTPEMEKRAVKTKGSKMSVGGIITKLTAAKMATASGVETWLASGTDEASLQKILNNTPQAGTCFKAKEQKIDSRRGWIAFGRQPKGSLIVDEGAIRALEEHKSLLPSGIRKVQGDFSIGEAVRVKTQKGVEMGRGLVNFSSKDIQLIKGHHSREVAAILGRDAADEVIHRDNLVLL